MANVNSLNGMGEHVSIEMGDLRRRVVTSIKEKLDNVLPSPFGESCCIYRVHEKFRKINEFAYTPETVAIGPFHHGKESLQPMEDHKLRYLRRFLERTTTKTTHDKKLQEFVEVVETLEERSRKCYSEPIKFNSDKFVEMMVVDGLFIIELFLKSWGEVGIDRDDPIFNTVSGIASLMRDMILLENQIPMFVLESIFNKIAVLGEGPSLTELSLRFFNPLMPRDDKVLRQHQNYEGKHLLDLLVYTTHPLSPIIESTSSRTWDFLPSVTKLRLAGIKFKKGSTTGSFLDLQFKNGVLEIPPILVQDQTDSVLRNLIASEQCCDGRNTYMTSYAFLMDSLINSADDVRILCHHGIILNYLGDDEDVAFLFNRLCNEVTLVNFYYSEICDNVNAYYKTRWNVWQATLKRDYFHNPWAILSFIAAILLLILTFTGSLFSILSFSIHKS